MEDNSYPFAKLLDRLKAAPYGAYAIDHNQSIVFWNDQAREILGFTAPDVLGRKCHEAVRVLALDGSTPVCTRNCPAIEAAIQGRIPPVSYARMIDASGHQKRVTMFPLIAADENDRPLLIHMFHETPSNDFEANDTVPPTLTPRERDILSRLASGLRPKDIAKELSISVHTVRKHIYNAGEKLESHGMLAAVLAAQRRSLI